MPGPRGSTRPPGPDGPAYHTALGALRAPGFKDSKERMVTIMQTTNDAINELLGNWWMLLVRGVAGILFAVLAVVWPGITLTALVYLFGVYGIVDGGFALWLGSVAAGANRRWWPFLLEGIAGIGAGVLSFVAPGPVALALVYLIA